MVGIHENIYSNSDWNLKIYVCQGNNEIFILNYNYSYNFAQYSTSNLPYYNLLGYNLKIIRTKMINNLTWDEQFYLRLEFENILNN